MKEVVFAILMLGGVTFVLLAAIGTVRMPDVYLRMQAASKAVTLGMLLMMTAVAVHFGTVSVAIRVLLIVAFLYLTAPIGAHIIGRAAYRSGIKPWHGGAGTDGQEEDELARRLEEETQQETAKRN